MYKATLYYWDTVDLCYIKQSKPYEIKSTNFDDLLEELEKDGFSYVGEYDNELYFNKDIENIHEQQRIFIRGLE